MKNKQIDKSSWKVFNFKDVFTFIRGRRYKTDAHIVGKIAYISSTKFNNGITGYVTPPEYMTIHENVLTLNNSGSIGYCFYHNYKFVCSDHCTVIDILDKNMILNIYIAMFLKPIIEKIAIKYGFAREMSNERLEKENVLLPIDSKGNPDWKFMQTYIKNLSKTIIYSNQNITHKQHIKNNLDIKNWKDFYIGGDNGLFIIEKGQEIISNLCIGKSPLISASKYNNANSGSYDNHKRKFSANKISVASNGTVGKSFYHDYDFIATSDANVLLLKNYELNKYLAQFLCVIIEHEMFRYGWGRKWGLDRMKQSVIKLPIDAHGNPDWEYMENYIKSLSYSSSL